MKIHALSYAVLTAAALALAPNLVAQDKPATKVGDKKPATAMPTEEEMMKKWEESATPGPAHKLLDQFIGEWNVASKWWMDPAAPPMESKGTSSARWILGGRFIQDDFNGEFMGKPLKGLGLTGYDNFKKKYNSFWADEGGTAMFTSTGTASADGKTFTFTGPMDDPMTGEKDKNIKFVIKMESKDRHVFEMFDVVDGKDKRMAEMIYTRK